MEKTMENESNSSVPNVFAFSFLCNCITVEVTENVPSPKLFICSFER